MSTETHATASAADASPRPARTSRLAGYGTLIVAALVLAMAVYITIGLFTMQVPESAQPPGPQFYPTILAICAYVLVALLVIQTLRHPETSEPVTTTAEHTLADETEHEAEYRSAADSGAPADTSADAVTTGVSTAAATAEHRPADGGSGGSTAAGPLPTGDLKALGFAVLAFLGFTMILEPVGWIVSAGLLFWAVAWALGSRRTLLDLGIGLVVASAVQVAFSLGLGLNLPSGVLGGIL